MVFIATFNNISVISWWSVLLVEETGVPGENHRPAASHWQTISHNVISRVHISWAGFKFTTLVVIGTDCIGNCKSNYDTVTTTTVPDHYCKIPMYAWEWQLTSPGIQHCWFHNGEGYNIVNISQFSQNITWRHIDWIHAINGKIVQLQNLPESDNMQ
jgi:hypothetical protein